MKLITCYRGTRAENNSVGSGAEKNESLVMRQKGTRGGAREEE